MTSGPPPPLQAHRTALSWLRTCFTAAVAAALVIRVGTVEHDALLVAAAFPLLAVALLAASTFRSRGRGASFDPPARHRALPGVIGWTAALSAGSGLVVAVAFLI